MGDGDGGGGGSAYHLNYEVATIHRAKSWVRGCTVHELRQSAGDGTPLARLMRHPSWNVDIGMAVFVDPGAAPFHQMGLK